MRVIEATNVGAAYHEVVTDILHTGSRTKYFIAQESRNGPVWVHKTPVTTVYKFPRERVLFNAHRDANPFFHVMEALWILAGSRSAKWISHFNKNMMSYSDDGRVFHGAYGDRLRNPIDQIGMAINHLIHYPNSRRCVLSIWNPTRDLNADRLDIPCNTTIYLRVHDFNLDMTVCCRSNDIIWGAYGANAVHFSFLQEYIAAHLDLGVGKYYHISNDFHVYMDNPSLQRHQDHGSVSKDRFYTNGTSNILPLVESTVHFDADLEKFMGPGWKDETYAEPFFEHVAYPMRTAWNIYKADPDKKRYVDVISTITTMQSDDWRMACNLWMNRRYNR